MYSLPQNEIGLILQKLKKGGVFYPGSFKKVQKGVVPHFFRLNFSQTNHFQGNEEKIMRL